MPSQGLPGAIELAAEAFGATPLNEDDLREAFRSAIRSMVGPAPDRVIDELAYNAASFVTEKRQHTANMAANMLCNCALVLCLYRAKQNVSSPSEELAEATFFQNQLEPMIQPILTRWLESLDIEYRRRGGKKQKADLSTLRERYDELLPVWSAAFARYRALEKVGRGDWRQIIKAEFQSLPDDLIERLNPAPDDSWVADQINKQGGESRPEDVAIEHAARICDAMPYAYKLTVLRKWLYPGKKSGI